MEAKMPIKYEILVEAIGNGNWRMDYAEYHTEEDWDKSREDSTPFLGQMGGLADIKIDDSLRKVYFSLQGPETNILNGLAMEFLMASEIGHMSLKDLFITITAVMAKAGVFERKEDDVA